MAKSPWLFEVFTPSKGSGPATFFEHAKLSKSTLELTTVWGSGQRYTTKHKRRRKYRNDWQAFRIWMDG